jgi:pyruvate dehydrogenase E2 component (dihydrolipoamide acetyltransferase)
MPTEVILPKVDMDMAVGKISAWHVKDGDTVKKGQVIFEIETDKAAMEIEAPADGVVRNLAPMATEIAVGSAVAFILKDGEALTAAAAVTPAKAGAQLSTSETVAKLDPGLRRDDENIETVKLNGTGVRATPLARRLARQKGINLGAVTGSGPRGRIVAKDVETAKIITPSAAPAPATVSLASVAANYAPGSFEVRPLDGMRRTIAQRLVQSKQTVPHFYLSVSCVLDQLLETRERLNGHAPRDADKNPQWKISVNDFVIKALALALQRVPSANVTWSDDGILQHTTSDVGVAVSVDGGLFTPVVRSAHAKTLSQISIEMKDLAARARSRKLKSDEYKGGTTAVSNLGMFGIEDFQAIINPPHATILAVGAGIEQFVPVEGKPVVKTLMKATLSCDHRTVDGAVGAQLLAAFKQLIEEPALMLA